MRISDEETQSESKYFNFILIWDMSNKIPTWTKTYWDTTKQLLSTADFEIEKLT